MTIYIFDMDGTLTPPRRPMTEEFAADFLPWLKKNRAFIATGSDFEKVREQMPDSLIAAFAGIYCAMGNDLWEKGKLVLHKDFIPAAGLTERLENYRAETKYPGRLYPNYIEKRTGMINFSVLGRDCPYRERELYSDWDKKSGERLKIQKELSVLYPQYDFLLGGTISIDIIKKGNGKSQIAFDLRQKFPPEEIIFFGDKTFPGGNDYELAYALKSMENTRTVQVNSPADVLDFLTKAASKQKKD